MNVISDIAGQYDAFRALLKQMPDKEVLSVGDMIDRGPKSKEVVDWFMEHGQALLGNHEHMMVDWVFNGMEYDKHIWTMNGGGATLRSYGFDPGSGDAPPKELIKAAEWMNQLPIHWENEKIFVSHTFIPDDVTLSRQEAVWRRRHPRPSNKVQIAGHNSMWGLRAFTTNFEEGTAIYALSIDTSGMGMICGVDTETMNIYVQPYL